MDVTYNNVLESTRQYFQGVPPAAAGVGHGGQHPGGGAGLAGLYNIQPNGGGGVGGGGQGQQNGPTANYYHHGGHHQPPSQPQRHLAAVQQQPQSIQPIPSYLTNGGVGGGGKTMYSPSPQPAPSPQDNIRMAPNAASKTHYHAHPQASPSPQEHRLPVGNAGKSMYSPHPQSSPSPQENVRLPSSSPFNNLAYANQLQHAQRNRLTPQTPSPLPQAHVKAHHPSAPSPGSLSSTSGSGSGVNYQRQVNGGASGGRYGSNYFYHQSLLQQQHELQQQQQQLQQQLQQQQQELKQQLHQQAFYSGLTNSSQQVPTSQIMQPQRHTSNQYTPVAPPSSRIHNTSSNNAPVDLARTSVNSSTNVASATATNLKRESPLDLSVKTVRQSADSTGHMDNANNNSESGTTYYYFQQEAVRGHHGPNSNSGQQSANYLTSHPNVQPTIAPKVDFSPNFSQHAHILQNHQQHKLPPRQHQSSHQQSTGHFSHHHQSQVHNQSSAQSHSHHQAMMDKQRWKEREAANYPLPSVSSVVKAASAGRSTHQNSGNLTTSNIPGTSGNVNHISGHYQMNQHGQPVLKSAYPAETARFSHNYLKRPVSSENLKASAPTAPKQSRHDTWKDSIDQQIEKRFNSYLSSKGIANGDVNKTSTPVNPQSSYVLPPSRNYNYDHHHQMSHVQQQQQQLIQQPQTYPTEKTSTPSHNSGNGAADKRVLSILRNSLETKEARLQQQQMTKSPLQYTELTTRPPAATSYPFAASNRNNLPAFQTGGAQDRNSAPVFQRLSIPKAVDSIQDGNKIALSYPGANHHPLPSHHQAYHPHQPPTLLHQPSPMGQRSSGATSCIRPNDVVDITNEEDNSHRVPGPKTSSSSLPPVVMSPQTAANSVSPAIPTSKPAEYDGFAAFIAARIRTKAELKQQPTTDQPSTPAGSSSLTSTSLSSPNFRSPYSNDLVKTPVASSDAYTSNSKCSPWPNSQHKTIKDQPLAASFPRRRESDSEGEAPTLERQPGRRTSVSSASSAVRPTTPTNEAFYPPTALELELKPIEEETYEEWLTYVDELIGHLEKDKFRRLKSMAKRPSIRGGRAGGRGAVVSSAEQAMTPSHSDGLQAVTPIVVKEEVPSTEVESSPNTLLRATQPPLEGQLPAVVIKEEALSEPETSQPQTKETSQLEVSPDIKSEFKEKKIPVNGSKRGGGRGRSRGGGPGSRGGRGGGKSKKTVYGDGSDFKTPGWEEDLYKFKKSLRMPPRLINISRPPGWPKAPLSLPDLEVYPDSPLTNDSVETFPGKSKMEKEDNVKEDEKKSIAKSLGEDQSFLDRLMAKYTARKKKNKKESPCKIEPKGDDSSPELLPTPSLLGSKDPSMLGFRKETIQEYREEFLKTGAFKAEADMPPTILETRTRTENKVFKERLTIREVFGAERPASAPPPGTTTDDLRRRHRLRKNKQKEKKKRMMARANHEKRQKGCSGNGGKDDVQSKSKTFRTFRRKLKSSGFDYIRKPKKKIAGPKKKLDNPHKPRKKIQPMTEEEIEELIKSWTLNKGVGETVLHRAAKNGLIDVARYLLDKLEQDPSPRDNAGYTPLHEACSRGHVAVAHLLLNYGASVEDSALGGVRPLHEAAENGFTKLVRLLLDYGADPMLATYSGVTALSLAAADEESRLLMEQHIAQNGSMSSSVHDDLASVPKESSLDGFEVEESHFPLPTLYRLSGESRSDSWILFHELAPLIKVKTKEALCKSLKQESSTIIRDIKLQDFFAKAHSRAIKSAPPTECPNKTPKLTLVKYTAEIKEMLDVETTVIPR